MDKRNKGRFIEPMLLVRTDRLPDDLSRWLYEIKLDGYRSIAFQRGGAVYLRSRNDNDFNGKYPAVVSALAGLPNETVIDGEVVALDESGRPSFNILQNFGSSKAPILYYVFDVLLLGGKDVMHEPLMRRRELLQEKVLPTLREPVRFSPEPDALLSDLIRSVKEQGLEGLVAKRRESVCEPGLRSGAWQKMRVNQGQGSVIGGYTVGGTTFDALVFGYYEGDKLMYAARTRNGFTPSLREELMKRLISAGRTAPRRWRLVYCWWGFRQCSPMGRGPDSRRGSRWPDHGRAASGVDRRPSNHSGR